MGTDRTAARRVDPGVSRRSRRVVYGLWSALLTAVLAVGVVQVVAPDPAEAATAPTFQLTGHGYGHGRGMGQYGAYGYATQYGWTYDQILARYYGGTTLGAQGNPTLTVQLTAQDNLPVKVTSGYDFTVGGVRVAANTAGWVQARADGTFVLNTSYGCASPDVWSTPIPNGVIVSSVASPGSDLTAMLSICTNTGTKEYRGSLQTLFASGGQRTVNIVAMEDYLRGVVPRESPASWGDAAGGRGIEALKSQTVAARSYAMGENRSTWAKTCDTASCQVYGGAGTNRSSIEDRRSDLAVASTAGQVLYNRSGQVVRAEFSSSTGGYTAGGTFPAVPDEGDSVSPYNTWTAQVSSQALADAFGVGQLVNFEVISRNGLGADGGRVLQARVTGTQKTVTVTGDQVRLALNLRSNWFTVTSTIYMQPTVYQSDLGGGLLREVTMGDPGDRQLSCDWNGDGMDTLGVFRRGVFYLSDQVNGGAPYVTVPFGNSTDQPICGDWDGDGRDTVGVYRSGVAYFRNSNQPGGVDGQLGFGDAGDVAVVGNWNGDPYDTLGVHRGNRFYITDSNLSAASWRTFGFGNPGDDEVAGDWNGDGTDTVAVRRGDTFYLRGEGVEYADYSVQVFGLRGDDALAGDWTGAGPDTVAVGRQ